MIEIDGSYLEGGGQILRTATALSAVTKKSCHIFNIRKNRPKPGIATQHLLGLQSLASLCGAKIEGDFLGSAEISFSPYEIQLQKLLVKIPTAGSITLALQSLILPCLFTESQTKILFDGGATDTHFSPTMDYFRYVFLKNLERLGSKVEIKIEKRGFYPVGGAKIETTVFPSRLKTVNLTERGRLQKILIISGASETLKTKNVAERQLAGVREILGKLKLPIEDRIEYYGTHCPGSQLCLIAEFENATLGADGLGKIGKRAEDIGRETALELLKESKTETCLDKHMADQILPYLALAPDSNSVTVSEITNHLKTNIWVIEKFIDGKFEIKNNLIGWMPQ